LSELAAANDGANEWTFTLLHAGLEDWEHTRDRGIGSMRVVDHALAYGDALGDASNVWPRADKLKKVHA
jgi:hypothetical protein